MEKVSVIIPAYNAEKTIVKCIKSLLAQTYPNYEIIVVNDGSKDKTLDILLDLSKQCDKLYVIDKQNQGPAMARNTALEAILSAGGGQYVRLCRVC